MRKIITFLIFFLAPVQALAVVRINEIAWMGTSASANAEWIELYNDSSTPVVLDDWTLVADDGSPNVVLNGTVAAGSFFLLERTSDDSVPGITASQIYTGALGNSGETLILKDAGGAQAEKVTGGENWQNIGGDNVTKQTPQRTAGGQWVTADPTPKNATVGGGTPAPDDTDGNQTDNAPASSSAKISSTEPITWKPDLYAYAGEDRKTVAGAALTFTGRALGAEKEPIERARYLWSFGEGSLVETQSTEHTWDFPGTYTVVVNVATGLNTASDRALVTVVPNKVAITGATPEYVELTNSSGVDVDLTNWVLRPSPLGAGFRFPFGTVIANGASVAIPSTVSGIVSADGHVELLYPNGTVATASMQTGRQVSSPAVEKSAPLIDSVRNKPPKPPVVPAPQLGEQEKPRAVAPSSIQIPVNNTDEQANVITIGGGPDENGGGIATWMLAVFGLGIVGGGGALLVRLNRPSDHERQEKLRI